MFPSPHSGILFLYVGYWTILSNDGEFPSPHSGILFLSLAKEDWNIVLKILFPSPHSGILFLSPLRDRLLIRLGVQFPSPHSGILFLWFLIILRSFLFSLCFRPLIRGFFFYLVWRTAKENNIKDPFPSPHSGILFLLQTLLGVANPQFYTFPSPHSGILFLCYMKIIDCFKFRVSFRPLIRGFFFYIMKITSVIGKLVFPSPHSGILFLFFFYAINGIEVVVDDSVSVPSFGDSFFIINNEDLNGTVTA